MAGLLRQISPEKLKSVPNVACNKPLDGADPCIFLLELVGTIKEFDNIAVRILNVKLD